MRARWNATIVISTIKELHETGKQLNPTHVNENNAPLFGAALRCFGSWKAAIEAAGLTHADVKIKKRKGTLWNKERIIEEILKLQEKEEPLNSFFIQKEHTALHQAALRYFGGWPQAITAAGLIYSEIRLRKVRVWTEVSLVRRIRRLYVIGIALDTASLQRDQSHHYIFSAGYRLFGSWAKAICAAGLDYSKIRKGRQPGWWTRPRIIARIIHLEKKGIRLSHQEMSRRYGALVAAAYVHFGCWSEAVEAAGISYRAHSRLWSTKAWLRRMNSEEYQDTLASAYVYAQQRRR